MAKFPTHGAGHLYLQFVVAYPGPNLFPVILKTLFPFSLLIHVWSVTRRGFMRCRYWLKESFMFNVFVYLFLGSWTLTSFKNIPNHWGAQIVNRAEPCFQEFSRWRKETRHSSNRRFTALWFFLELLRFKLFVTVSLELSYVFCALQLYVPKQLPGRQVLTNLYLPQPKFWLPRATGQRIY